MNKQTRLLRAQTIAKAVEDQKIQKPKKKGSANADVSDLFKEPEQKGAEKKNGSDLITGGSDE